MKIECYYENSNSEDIVFLLSASKIRIMPAKKEISWPDNMKIREVYQLVKQAHLEDSRLRRWDMDIFDTYHGMRKIHLFVYTIMITKIIVNKDWKKI